MANNDNLWAALAGFTGGVRDVLVPWAQNNIEEQRKRRLLQEEAALSRATNQQKLRDEYSVRTPYEQEKARYQSDLDFDRSKKLQEQKASDDMALLGKKTAAAREIAGMRGKAEKPTDTQRTTNIYANRLEQAEKELENYGDYTSTVSPIKYGIQAALPESGFLGAVTNKYKSPNFQGVSQAQKNFLTAALRKESGAVISKEEMETGKSQYFVQPGDSPKVIAQKDRNRKLLIEQFKNASGSAYEPSKFVTPYDNDSALESGSVDDILREFNLLED